MARRKRLIVFRDSNDGKRGCTQSDNRCESNRIESVQLPRNVLLLFLILQTTSLAAETCSVCPDGQPILYPNKTFDIDGLPIDNCQDLSAASVLLQSDAPLCNSIHSISTLCGCNYDTQTSCSLCHDASPVQFPSNKLPQYLAQDFILGAPPNIPLNCESLQAILHQQSKDTITCIDAQYYAASLCGCPQPPQNTNETDTIKIVESDEQQGNATTTTTTTTTNNPQDIDFCTVCLDGEPISLPDRPLVVDGLPIEKCSDLVSFSGFLEIDSDECKGIQTIGTYCGCSYKLHDVTFCPDGSELPDPEKIISWVGDDYTASVPESLNSFSSALTCGLYEAALQNLEEEFGGLQYNFLVMTTHLKSGSCGCSHDWRGIVLTWTHRVAGVLSFLGSLTISVDVMSSKKKLKRTYHQLVLGMSLFDMLNSASYAASTLMVSPDSGLYQSAGTDFTCKLQGFMIQFGLTSCMFNAMLATYFMLITTRGWKEHIFRKMRMWAYLAATVVGLALACAGLPFYAPLYAVCYVTVPPVVSTWAPISLLFTLPVASCLFIATVSLILICRKVYRVELKSMRWSTRNDSVLLKKVLHQTFFYLLSFNVTLPCLLLSFYIGGRTAWDTYGIFLATGIMAPLQGLLNACVYYHRERRFSCGWCGSFSTKLRSSLSHNKDRSDFLEDQASEAVEEKIRVEGRTETEP